MIGGSHKGQRMNGCQNRCQGRRFGFFFKPIPLTTDRPLPGTPISQTKNAILPALAPFPAYIFIISDAFFADDFETGDTSGWSATVP